MNDAEIDDRFFNFAPATLEAIRTYQRTQDPALIEPIFQGIMAKYLPEELRVGGLATGDPSLTNVFGLESLTMLEVVLDLQDALGIRLEDHELRELHNLHEAHAILVQKVEALRRELPPAVSPAAP